MLWILNSILLGIGLAMDAFTVSIANGLHEQHMKQSKQLKIAGVFAFFQALMPMLGWVCVHTIVQAFSAFEALIPWIALLLLGFIGGKMVIEGIQKKHDTEAEDADVAVGTGALLMQGIATAIDALSVGFTIAEDPWNQALLSALIIAAVTFVICLCGVKLGKKVGIKLAEKATVLGGLLLIGIGLEIFIKGVWIG